MADVGLKCRQITRTADSEHNSGWYDAGMNWA
jgi:hypothetical protein